MNQQLAESVKGGGKMQRFSSERFKFDVENYNAALPGLGLMKHIKIYCEGAMQVDLWLNKKDLDALKETVSYSVIE